MEIWTVFATISTKNSETEFWQNSGKTAKKGSQLHAMSG